MDRALAEAKPAIDSGVIADSDPPVTTTSQSPHWMERQAMPIACPADAQALDVVNAVPCSP